MADSGALRQRRSKAHKAGDHSLCGGRCNLVRSAPPKLTIVPPSSAAELDPVAEMRALASRLAAAHEADPANAMLAEALRKTLAGLMPKGAGKQDEDLTGLFSALQA